MSTVVNGDNKPWDARLAAWLVRPLGGSPVRPNHLTTVRLVVGMAGCALFAAGDSPLTASLLVVLSNFLDHTDGELARMTGTGTPFGHAYDLASDAVITVGLFAAIAVGERDSMLGSYAPLCGVLAGAAVAGIFHLRNVIESTHGKSATRQQSFAGFETEDVLYLLPLVVVFDGLDLFLVAAALGAPIALLVVGRQYRQHLLEASRG